MHPRIAEIAEQLERTRRELLAAVPSRLAPADLARRPAAGAWSIAEIVDHCSSLESTVARMVERSLTRAGPEGLPRERSSESVVTAFDGAIIRDRSCRFEAPAVVQPRPGVSAAEARSALDASREALRAAMSRADGYDLGSVSVPHPALGSLTLYQWLLVVAYHDARHAAQIAEVATRHVTGEHPVVGRVTS